MDTTQLLETCDSAELSDAELEAIAERATRLFVTTVAMYLKTPANTSTKLGEDRPASDS